MGILYPLIPYVNKLIAPYVRGEKSAAFASEREKRATRYANAYHKNAAVIHFLNHKQIQDQIKKDE